MRKYITIITIIVISVMSTIKVNASTLISTSRVWDTGSSGRYLYNCNNGTNGTTDVREYYMSFQYNAIVPQGANEIVIPLSFYITLMNSTQTNQFNSVLNSALQVTLKTNQGDWGVCGVSDTKLTCSVHEGWEYQGVNIRFMPSVNGFFDCIRVSLNQIVEYRYSNDMNDIYNNISDVQVAINDVETAITNQTTVLQSDHTYNTTPSESINGTSDVETYEQEEQTLMNSLDFTGINDVAVTINPTASQWIWNTATRFRGIHAKIILLMTSILGLGIAKMILNR